MKWLWTASLALALSSCANVSTTRFEYCDASGARVVLEMPKEVDATGLLVDIDAKGGHATITAETWTSRNVETIQAQGDRESGNIKEGAGLAGKIAEGVTKGAVKAIVPLP